MNRGEIALAHFPFGDVTAMKLRPVLLLTGSIGNGTEILVAYISSVLPSTPLATDIVIDPLQNEFKSTRLKVKSVLRLHKLATIHVASLQRNLGRISLTAQKDVDDILRAMLNL